MDGGKRKFGGLPLRHSLEIKYSPSPRGATRTARFLRFCGNNCALRSFPINGILIFFALSTPIFSEGCALRGEVPVLRTSKLSLKINGLR